MKGLRAGIFKHEGQTFDHLGNFSSRVDNVTIVGFSHHWNNGLDVPPKDSGLGPFEPTPDAPPVVIVTRWAGKAYLTAYPVDITTGKVDRDCMFGGTYISTSDSRFPSEYPIPLHDRKE